MPGGLYRDAALSSEAPSLTINDAPVALRAEKGFLRLKRAWKNGDRIVLLLPMRIRRVLADERVESDRGRVALERGPLVYCVEGADFRRSGLGRVDGAGTPVRNLVLPDSARLEPVFFPSLLGGVEILRGQAVAMSYLGGLLHAETVAFTAIPYFAWAHRGAEEMTVWIPRTPGAAQPVGGPSIVSRAELSASGGDAADAVRDGVEPRSSADSSHGYFHSAGDTVWLEYRFPRPLEISAAEVYWFDDGDSNGRPNSWRVLLWQDGRWVPAYTQEKRWDVELNRFNRVVFEAFRTQAVRLEAVPAPGRSVGVLEWRVL